MPTLSALQIPPPANWQDFEQITLAAMKTRWSSPNLQRNGRSGQPQAGVDVYGEDDLARLAGVQCKLLADGPLSIKVIEAEVEKAEAFAPGLQAYYLATTAETDVKIQQAVRLLSQTRISKGAFPVGVLFWEDVLQDLVKNHAEFRVHYPDLHLKDMSPSNPGLLPILDLAHSGTSLRYYMGLLFGEVGWMAQEDPEQFRMLADTIKVAAVAAVAADRAAALCCDLDTLVEGAMAIVHGKAKKADWAPLNSLARRIEQRVRDEALRLGGIELAAFVAGEALQAWDEVIVENEEITRSLAEKLKKAIKRLSRDAWKEVAVLVKSHRKDSGGMRHTHSATRAYGIVRRSILYLEMSR